ncbi:MAG: DHHW family protein [Terrisporobacter sp.]
MNTKLKNKIISISFIGILISFTIINFISSDKEISYYERRKLEQLPTFYIKSLMNGDYFEDFEKYVLDQFVLRDEFRYFKALTSYRIFNEKDNNNIYMKDDYIFKMEYPLKEESVYNASNIYNKIAATYFEDANVYYTIVPDKNYFVCEDKNRLLIDYNKMFNIMKKSTKDMKYIDIAKDLSLSDYYETDIHWKQENILNISDILLTSMGNNKKASDYDYTSKVFYPFYGSYYGQAAMKSKPDKLVYLSNKIIKESKVYDYEDKSYKNIYDDKVFDNVDSYDVFLSGAKPLLQIENPNNKSNEELYIFRDSFGSSIAPLLISEYSRVTLIDLRYITLSELNKYIEPKKDADVLFMYNTLVLNDSSTISR